MNIKGNYPFAVLHVFRTEGFKPALDYTKRVCRVEINHQEALAYLTAVIKTSGHPKLLDLYE